MSAAARNGARSITVVTSGHLSTCPRMVKAADAFAAEGYVVRVVSTRFVGWATAADAALRASRDWRWTVVDYSRGGGNGLRIRSGIRMRAAGKVVDALGARTPAAIAARAYARVHTELVEAVAENPGDLIYAGTGTALAAAAEAARRTRTPYALDLEDFHSGEHGDVDPRRDALAGAIERSVLGGARFLTTSSVPIQGAYRERYGVAPTVVHNVVPLPPPPPSRAREAAEPLRLYWFSQTIGRQRGLEHVVRAAGLLGARCELHLRGCEAPGYLAALTELQRLTSPLLTIVHHPPAPPDDMIALCYGYDVGLATEEATAPNRVMAASNKIFTYLAAGLPVAGSDTPGQRSIAQREPHAIRLFVPDDAGALAAILRCWSTDGPALETARRSAWNAAVRRWHWDHAEERGALVGLVGEALKS